MEANRRLFVLLRSSQLGIGSETPEALKTQILSKDYAHLCAQKVTFTDSLFGDDVTKQIKDITDYNKVTNKLLDKTRCKQGPW